MPVPRSVIKFDRGGVKYESSVDKTLYTMDELIRAALRDVGRYISRMCNKKIGSHKYGKALYKTGRNKGKTSAFQFWVRKNEKDLQVGIKHDTWYGVNQELGTKGMRKLAILDTTTRENIAEIVKIESQYLEFMEDEAAALSRISENEYQGGDEDD